MIIIIIIMLLSLVVVVVIIFPTEYKQWRSTYMSNNITPRKQ